MKFSAILLSAGKSSRMKVNKLLLPYKNARIIDHSVDSLLASQKINELIVVVRPDLEMNLTPHPKMKIVENSHYQQGMSTSLKLGIQATSNDIDAYILALADMPDITTTIIDKIIQAFEESKKLITVPRYNGKNGHPVIINKQLKEILLSQKGDVGARYIIQRYHNQINWLDLNEPSVIFDLDTLDDLQKATQLFNKTKKIE